MKITLIFPNYNLRKVLKTPFHPPLGLAMIAAVLEKAGYAVSIIDAAALDLKNKELLAKLHEIDPDVIGITTNIVLAHQSLELSVLIRRYLPNTKLVFGGPWASAVYEMLLQKNFCDFVIVGEGEYAFIELLRAIEKEDLPEKNPGIAYFDPKAKSIQLEPACLIDDLDALPLPAWHLFPPAHQYPSHRKGQVFYPIMTSRGCPYQCNHCTKIVHGSKVRFRKIENIINEIRHLKENFGLEEITIIDDNFIINKKRAEKILDEIIRNNFNIHIQFSNGVRADMITPQFVRKLKRAGTYKMAIGVESGNQEVVNKIGKKLSLNAVRRAAKMIKNEGIILMAFFIIGHPFDTVKTMNDTINFAIEIDPDIPLFFKAIPFPGTELYNQVLKEGKFITSLKDIEQGYYYGGANFEIYDLRAADVEKMFKVAYRRFYLRPRKLLSSLGKIRTSLRLKPLIRNIVFNLLRFMFF
jgi:anaerobic magnesium-protoporphyrin IX monomethyl ester cyclase